LLLSEYLYQNIKRLRTKRPEPKRKHQNYEQYIKTIQITSQNLFSKTQFCYTVASTKIKQLLIEASQLIAV